MGPEVLHGQPYDTKADVWSVGTVLFQMLTGSRPFEGEDLDELKMKIQKSVYAIPRNMIVSQNLLAFLNSCLRINSDKRLNWDELLQHPFLQRRTNGNHKLIRTLQVDPNETINFRQVYDREIKPKIIKEMQYRRQRKEKDKLMREREAHEGNRQK